MVGCLVSSLLVTAQNKTAAKADIILVNEKSGRVASRNLLKPWPFPVIQFYRPAVRQPLKNWPEKIAS